MAEYLIGLSLGQVSSTSALAIAERIKVDDYHIRHLERFPAGTSYPAIVERIGKLVTLTRGQAIKGHEWNREFVSPSITLAIDATAAGRPVADMFKALNVDTLIGVTITGGDAETDDNPNGYKWVRMPKRILVSTVQALLQTDRLKIAPKLEDAETLKSNLAAFQLKGSEVTADANAMLWREGALDDYVFAVALSCWAKPGRFEVHHIIL